MARMESQTELNSMNGPDVVTSILVGIVRPLVSAPDEVTVDAFHDSAGYLLTLQVSEQDLDTVIGVGGRTARSLRTVLTALGRRSGQRFTLDIQPRIS